jgi:hypothetical protein
VSPTLDAALQENKQFVDPFWRKGAACEVLMLATQLRNPLLFREALIWAANPSNSPECKEHGGNSAPKLRKVVETVHYHIGFKASVVQQEVFSILAEIKNPKDPASKRFYCSHILFPQYFQRVACILSKLN